MKDNEIRGLLLGKYYERRREQYIDLQSSDFGEVIAKKDILCVSQQLYEHGLIEWTVALGETGQIMDGRGHITASGVDIVENEGIGAPIKITFDQSTHYSIQSSSGVQIGNANKQGDSVNLSQVIDAINNSAAPAKDKAEAKSRLLAFLKHPLVTTLVGKLSPDVDKMLSP